MLTRILERVGTQAFKTLEYFRNSAQYLTTGNKGTAVIDDRREQKRHKATITTRKRAERDLPQRRSVTSRENFNHGIQTTSDRRCRGRRKSKYKYRCRSTELLQINQQAQPLHYSAPQTIPGHMIPDYDDGLEIPRAITDKKVYY